MTRALSVFSTLPLLLACPLVSSCGSPPAAQSPTPAAGEAATPAEPVAETPAPAEAAPAPAPAAEAPEAPAPAEAGDGAAAPPSDGETRTMEVIQTVILNNRPKFRACYDSVQAKVPELKGDLTLHFVLSAEGRVKKAELNQPRSTIKNAELTECAIGELRKLQFPASSKGLETKVNYPFNFNPH